jgi:hypothetical protein
VRRTSLRIRPIKRSWRRNKWRKVWDSNPHRVAAVSVFETGACSSRPTSQRMAGDRRIARLRRSHDGSPLAAGPSYFSGNPPLAGHACPAIVALHLSRCTGHPRGYRPRSKRFADAYLTFRPADAGRAYRCCPGLSWSTARRSSAELTTPQEMVEIEGN